MHNIKLTFSAPHTCGHIGEEYVKVSGLESEAERNYSFAAKVSSERVKRISRTICHRCNILKVLEINGVENAMR